MFKSQTLLLFIFSLSILASCIQQTPTELTYSDSKSGEVENEESAFKSLMVSKCLSCHSSSGSSSDFDVPIAELVTRRWIRPGKPEDSSLYYRLKNVGLGKGSENMPVGKSFSDDHREIIYNFILKLNPNDFKSVVNKPSFSISALTFNASFDLRLINNDILSTLKYSLNKSISTCADGLPYNTSISIPPQTTTVYAVACNVDGEMSEVVSETYTYSTSGALPPVINVDSKIYKDPFIVKISGAGTLRYTLTGIDPTCSSGTVYSGDISVSGMTRILKAISCDALAHAGAIATKTYTFDNVGPAVTITAPILNAKVSDKVIVRGACENGLTLNIKATNVTGVTTCSGGAYSLELSLLSLAEGKISLSAEQRDAAGNVGTASLDVQYETLTSSSQRFNDALSILQAKCISCHKAGGDASSKPFNFTTEDDFFASQWFKKGDARSPALIFTKGSGSAYATMPLGSTPWQTSEYDTLASWIMKAGVAAGPVTYDTSFGGNGDTNTVAPLGKSTFFDMASSYNLNSLASKCDASKTGSVRDLRRLTSLEYKNTLKDLLIVLVGSTDGTVVNNGLASALEMIPVDVAPSGSHKLLSTASADTFLNHADVYLSIAEKLGADLETRKVLLLGSCAATITKSCFETFLKGNAKFIFRRPLSADDVTFYSAIYSDRGLKKALAALFAAPHFIFHNEYANSSAAKVFTLDNYELASRLSYALWGTMPDATLFAKADAGLLTDQAEFKTQALRLFEATNTKNNIDNFVEEWLKLDLIPEINMADVRANILWSATASPSDITNPAALKAEIKNEIKELVKYYIYDAPDSSKRFSGLLMSKMSKAGTQMKATIYKAEGTTTKLNGWFELNQEDSRGILGRPAFNLIGGSARRPVIKSVKLIERILCRDINAPADNSPPDEAVFHNDMTTRESITAATEIAGTSCIGCHQVMNPFGFALERFDSFGRKSLVEHVLNPNDPAPTEYIAIKNSDTATQPYISSSVVNVQGPATLSQALAESFEVHQCFTRFWWRYVNRRLEDSSQDSCHLDSIYKKLEDNNKGLPNAMLEGVLHQNFKVRKKD